MKIIEEARQSSEECIALRRLLHRYPELSSHEEKTISLIKSELEANQIPYEEIQHGGLIGWIQGKNTGKSVLLRADIDALPMQESPCNPKGIAKSCISEVEGVQHACGHDGHTAMLLTAAKLLQTHADELDGTVYLCFERGEEATMNVYHIMKWLEKNKIKPDRCFGIHTSPFYQPGSMMIQAGPLMAGMFSFHVRIEGKGGHGSRPDLCNNPIDCYSAMSQAIASLRMRYISPFEPLTYSIGLLQSGTKSNILPDVCLFKGTVRFYNRQVGLEFQAKLRHVIDHIAQAYDCVATFDKLNAPGFPLSNDEACATLAKQACREIFEEELVIDGQPWMGTDSFPFYLQRMPGVYAFLSTNNPEKGIVADVHHTQHDLDESVLYRGVAAHVACAIAFLKQPADQAFQANPDTIDEIFVQAGYGFYEGKDE